MRLWQQIASAGVDLQCLTLTASSWVRPILYREIAVLDRFALRSIEPAESAGHDLHVFFLPRLASILADLRPLSMFLPDPDALAWLEILDRVDNTILTV
jgi:hypothetical protein